MVGAGLAGAVSARVLKDAGYLVEVFEFARASRQELPATERAGAPFRSSGRWSTRPDRYASGIDPPGLGAQSLAPSPQVLRTGAHEKSAPCWSASFRHNPLGERMVGRAGFEPAKS